MLTDEQTSSDHPVMCSLFTSLLPWLQALKFEPYHDSLLARFLLQRALSNKRVGHFFFWYLRCEMVNPQYTTRFGVILEAYLTGCGEAMLRQFEHQAEMQTTLEEIASLVGGWMNRCGLFGWSLICVGVVCVAMTVKAALQR